MIWKISTDQIFIEKNLNQNKFQNDIIDELKIIIFRQSAILFTQRHLSHNFFCLQRFQHPIINYIKGYIYLEQLPQSMMHERLVYRSMESSFSEEALIYVSLAYQ